MLQFVNFLLRKMILSFSCNVVGRLQRKMWDEVYFVSILLTDFCIFHGFECDFTVILCKLFYCCPISYFSLLLVLFFLFWLNPFQVEKMSEVALVMIVLAHFISMDMIFFFLKKSPNCSTFVKIIVKIIIERIYF